jgi:hypothetical protein
MHRIDSLGYKVEKKSFIQLAEQKDDEARLLRKELQGSKIYFESADDLIRPCRLN